LEWERFRYLSTLLYNVNCNKVSQTKKPQDLFPLPQDVYERNRKAEPKSTPEQLEDFLKKLENQKVVAKFNI